MINKNGTIKYNSYKKNSSINSLTQIIRIDNSEKHIIRKPRNKSNWTLTQLNKATNNHFRFQNTFKQRTNLLKGIDLTRLITSLEKPTILDLEKGKWFV